jgi:hypothetical protein
MGADRAAFADPLAVALRVDCNVSRPSLDRGVSEDEAEERAARTVNKERREYG